MNIALATINARYAHSALALRYLKANLGALEAQAEIFEFVSGARTETMAEALLKQAPAIIGLSVYIWNVDELTRLASLLKTLAPEIVLIIGGPEVSHETEQQVIYKRCDFVITGAAERAFAQLCREILSGKRPIMKKIAGDSLRTDGLVLPYYLYSDEDIKNRFVYLEASRGCPFKCEFCLSSLDKTAVPFAIDDFLQELAKLYGRGARTFKFIDRTFNLRIDDCERLLNFFLARLEVQPQPTLLLHFELIPDHLPERLRELIARFPAGVLQFEIGIQSWNPQVQARISRRQNNEKSQSNLTWLKTHSHAHLHVDLIAGLPGENLASFAQGFDRLVRLRPHEIQLGILKRLRGTPIIRHTTEFDLRFNPSPPYNLVSSQLIPFAEMQHLQRFARFWDLIANSGHFSRSMPYVLGPLLAQEFGLGPADDRNDDPSVSPFARFSQLSKWIYGRTDSTHRFSAERLYALVGGWLADVSTEPELALAAINADQFERLGRPKKKATNKEEVPNKEKPISGQTIRGRPKLRHQRAITPPATSGYLTTS